MNPALIQGRRPESNTLILDRPHRYYNDHNAEDYEEIH